MNASQFETRLKELLARLQSEFGEPKDPTTGDVAEEILLGIFGRDTTEAKARDALKRLRTGMVDYNEMRVAAPVDVIEELGPNFPGVREKALGMVRILSTIYEQMETLDLAEMKAKPKREAQKWLSDLPGMDPYTLGRVMLLCFGGHAVPVSTSVLANLQAQGLFEPTVTTAEAQSVLERHVRAQDAMKAFWLLHRYAEKHPASPPKAGAAKPAADNKKKPAKGPEKAADKAGGAKTKAKSAVKGKAGQK
jgi:endonuclease III